MSTDHARSVLLLLLLVFVECESLDSRIVPRRRGWPTLFDEFDQMFEDMSTLLSHPDERGMSRLLRGRTPWYPWSVFGDEAPLSRGHNVKLSVSYDENAEGYKLVVCAPGVDPADVKVSVRNNILFVEGEARHEEKGTRLYSSFRRSVTLPEDADGHRLTTSVANGEVAIELPKIAPTVRVQPKAIVGGRGMYKGWWRPKGWWRQRRHKSSASADTPLLLKGFIA